MNAKGVRFDRFGYGRQQPGKIIQVAAVRMWREMWRMYLAADMMRLADTCTP